MRDNVIIFRVVASANPGCRLFNENFSSVVDGFFKENHPPGHNCESICNPSRENGANYGTNSLEDEKKKIFACIVHGVFSIIGVALAYATICWHQSRKDNLTNRCRK